jgi:CheY-like chemotaxis protein
LIRQTFPKTIESSAALAPDLPLITADKNQIEQALLNLCVNARDAMPNGGRLIFRTEAVDAAVIEALGGAREERYVCIEVSDTGAGIDEAIQKRIFEPFFTTKDMGQGTGLGLSVVYGIVQNHRGVIDVKSSAGCGASFRLYFPVSAQLSEVEPVVKREGEIAARSEVGATVFVVEDEQSMLHVLETVLAQHGYRVLKATDGKMALEIYQTHRESIDVILLDIGLPKITGLDVLSRIKEQNPGPGARVIVASGYLDPELRTKIHQNGVQHFVHKPYVPVDVIQTIRNLTARRRGSEFST